MTARKIDMFKAGYEGERPEGRLTPLEADRFEQFAAPLIRRLHDAMLTLGALDAHRMGGGSSMPEYIHTFADKVGWEVDVAPAVVKFRPTAANFDDFLPTMALVDGLSPVFLKVLALRAVGERVGGFSFAVIAERFGRPEAWARRVYTASVVLAARRAGLLDPAPKGHAILIAGVRVGGWRTFLTTARDPQAALYDLKAKSPLELESAIAFWTAGKPEAAQLAQVARKNLLGRVLHGSWHLIPPDDMTDLLIEEQTRLARPWEAESLPLPTPRGAMKSAARIMGDSARAARAQEETEG